MYEQEALTATRQAHHTAETMLARVKQELVEQTARADAAEKALPDLNKLRIAFDMMLVAEVNRHDGIPHLHPEEMELREVIAELLEAR